MEENLNINCLRGVDCLVVKKVYDAFSRRECLENISFEVQLPGGCMDDYTFCHTVFGKAHVFPYDNAAYLSETNENYARLSIIVGIPVFVVLKRKCDKTLFTLPAHPIFSGVVQKDNILRLPVESTVYAPRDYLRQGRFDVMAETFIKTGCVNICRGEIITLSLGIFLVIKITSDVSLRIPNYGYCEIPGECEDECCENFCENFLDETITPFPQFFPDDIC